MGHRAADDPIEITLWRPFRKSVILNELRDCRLAQRRLTVSDGAEDKRRAEARRQQPRPESPLPCGKRDDVVSIERAQNGERSEAVFDRLRSRSQLVQAGVAGCDLLGASTQSGRVGASSPRDQTLLCGNASENFGDKIPFPFEVDEIIVRRRSEEEVSPF